MVIGLIPTSANAETLLNNLSEADFAAADISVIMADLKARDAISNDAGPFKGVKAGALAAKLQKAKLAAKDAKLYQDGVLGGKVFVAIRTAKASEAAASEMLKDHQGEGIRVLPI